MPPALRVLPLALVAIGPAMPLVAQSSELPPIFAPRPPRTEEPAPAARSVARPAAPVSDYLRRAITETVLANAEVFAVPPHPAAEEAGAPTYSAEGALLMPRFVVKSKLPDRKEFKPPPVVLHRFAPMERLDRQRNAWSANLWASGDGLKTFELNVVNGAGYGLDHNVDFTRVELAFRVRF